ncbi:hypothetical protein [Thiocapsa bogorovii]|uniref:hypothetical protein n=1 Tax=Thiocapsa bogorovii TaxID=521689 RepID=UPI001E639E74|nr:hypothetical protein [Thiocapsa bogorovii]UHD16637.1 hypothetical protein LT988_00810 [Thiocapsa bogorovii]
MNQRFDLVVIVGAIFLAIFVATAVILLVLGVPVRDSQPVADAVPAKMRPLERPQTFTVPKTPTPPTPPAAWRDDRFSQFGSRPDSGSVIDGYRFRPLDEREQRRFGGWADSRESGSTDWLGGGDRGLDDPVFRRDDRLPEGFTSGWSETPYRFRPTDPARRPLREPPRPGGFADQGFFESPPQWGATPPVLPPPLPPPLPDLYPSLVPPNDPRLTVR